MRPSWWTRVRTWGRRHGGRETGVIDRILEEDLKLPRKQRHTAKHIFERLRDEYEFDGGYTIVKDCVREHRRRTREMFVPLSHPPGQAQCDFGGALVVTGRVQRKAHCFVLDLPHSDGCFVKAYPDETTEAFLDGHVSAFAFLRGVLRDLPLQDRPDVLDAVAATGGAQKFPYAASLRIWLSKLSSATARLRRLFSVSSCFRRRACRYERITERRNRPRRRIWSARQSAALFDLPTDEAALLRHYTVSDDDIERVRVRRGDTISWASCSSFAYFDIRGGFWLRRRPFPCTSFASLPHSNERAVEQCYRDDSALAGTGISG